MWRRVSAGSVVVTMKPSFSSSFAYHVSYQPSAFSLQLKTNNEELKTNHQSRVMNRYRVFR
jgi:hypothetical protein